MSSNTNVMDTWIVSYTQILLDFVKQEMDEKKLMTQLLSSSSQQEISVHFQVIPKSQKTLVNNDIERAVAVAQTVIGLGRTVRERKIIPMKYPLPEFVAIHKDVSVLKDVQSLEDFVREVCLILLLSLTFIFILKGLNVRESESPLTTIDDVSIESEDVHIVYRVAKQTQFEATTEQGAVESSQRETSPGSVEFKMNSSRSSSQSRVTNSYDLNQGSVSSARQRRREYKLQSSTEYLTSQVSLTEETEKKKEGEKDINDLVFMLTATLQLPPTNIHDSNELSYSSSNTNDKNTTENRSSQNKIWSSDNRKISDTLYKTNHIYQRWKLIQESCLREISLHKLRRVLKIVENASEPQMMQDMIEELGEDLYNRYSTQIFLLKFYEDNFLLHQ
ncbi:unnamed protein product [Rotaria sordida]|uniref:Uncharacterized protein n=1 Tax=Rotaria sordida TaxID=392033 RepID=A0A813RJI6_9BILA|nr:unnamed protein product [Rotaria sordida]CAF0781216.1 unnamed protein product [Rotaria sordida]